MDEAVIDSTDYEYDHNVEYDENDHDAYLSDEDSEYGAENAYDPYVVNRELWNQLRIGTTTISVSTLGRVKLYGSLFAPASEGVQYPGTPYRIYRVNEKIHYIHELVWRAFRGAIPQGYEIRHNMHYVQKRARKVYTNRLECLTCERSTITPVACVL